MRIRTFAAATLVAATVSLPLAGTAFAADKNCADFATKAEAVAAAQGGDPFNLDEDDDGDPCESRFGSGGAGESDDDQVSATPVGGVEAGGGPESALSGGLVAAVGALAAGGVGAVAVRRFARRTG